MSESATDTILDPICDMVVSVADARGRGLVLEHAGRDYAFCSPGCRTTFEKDPGRHVAKVYAWLRDRGATAVAHAHGLTAAPDIDAGMRAWYTACRCCLSDAFPTVAEALDRERDAQAKPAAEAGICETAEAKTPTS